MINHFCRAGIITFLVILLLSSLVFCESISIKKGPSYLSYIDNIQRFLPNISIEFQYKDSITQRNKFVTRTTDSAGNIMGGPLPISDGATVEGRIKATYNLSSCGSIHIDAQSSAASDLLQQDMNFHSGISDGRNGSGYRENPIYLY